MPRRIAGLAPPALIATLIATLLSAPPLAAQEATAAAPAAAARPGATPEPVLLDLHVGNLASQTVPALRAGDEALLPLAPLLALAEVRHRAAPDGGVEGMLQPGAIALRVAPGSDTAWAGTRAVIARPGQIVLHEGELHVATAVLAGLLDVNFNVSWPDLNVTITNPELLPLARRLEREGARERLLRQREYERGGGDRLLEPDRPVWDGLVIDYSASAPSGDPLRGGSYSVGVGVDLFGGSLEGTAATLGPGAGRMRYQGSWLGVWERPRWLRQVRLGDGLTTGTRLRPVRGLVVSNSPYVRPAAFGYGALQDVLRPGWEVELYRDGRLIAFDTANALGSFALEVPVQYGVNPYEIVAYGPFGEIRRLDRTLYVAEELVQPGAVEYGVSAGACAPLAPCEGTGNLDVRYGLSPRWTLRGGADHFSRARGSDLYPYASIAGNPTGAVSVQLEGVPGALLRADLRVEPSTRLRLSASAARYDPGLSEPLLAPPGRRGAYALNAYVRPEWLGDAGYFFGDAERIESGGEVTRVRAGTALQRRHGQLMVYGRAQQDVTADGTRLTRDYLGLSGFLLPSPAWGRLFARAWLRGTLELEDAVRPWQASATIARSLWRGVRVEAGGSWSRPIGAAATLLLAADLGGARAYTTVTAPESGEPTATQMVQGSVLWDRATDVVRLSPGPSLQRGGVSGRVYLDVDGDGRFGPGDEAVRGTFVRVGTMGAITDSLGRYHVWDVSPFSPVPVEIDSLTLPSPLWVQREERVALLTGPNRFRPLDVAVMPGGEVEGRVVLERFGMREPVPGAHVTMRGDARGARALTTFSDGSFSVIALRPGSYEVAVSPRDLAQLRATAETHRFDVRPLPDGDRIVLEIVLRSTDTPPEPVAPEIAVAEPPPIALELPVPDALRPLLDSTVARVVLHDILFAHDSDRLQLQSVPTLTAIGELLVSRPELALRIEGHTDSVGGDAYNRRLSDRRAAAVRRYLLERYAVAPARLVSRGFGESTPIATNGTAEGRQLNRRVELVLISDEEAARERATRTADPRSSGRKATVPPPRGTP